jgi:hypothetical protein
VDLRLELETDGRLITAKCVDVKGASLKLSLSKSTPYKLLIKNIL